MCPRESTIHSRSAMIDKIMRNFTAVVERDPATGLFVGSVPGWSGAHSQGATLDELQANLREVIEMLLEDGEPNLESEFVGTANVRVA
jgi:predicted RNase H-like HicB family nuclease